MASDAHVYFLIRPKDRTADHDALVHRLRRLDEALTETVPGGVGDYDHDRQRVEVWLFDEGEEPAAHRIIEEHGFVIVDEEEVFPNGAEEE